MRRGSGSQTPDNGRALIAICNDAAAFGAKRFTPSPALMLASAAKMPSKLAMCIDGTVSAGSERPAIALNAACNASDAPGRPRLSPSEAASDAAADTLALAAAPRAADAWAESAACRPRRRAPRLMPIIA